ncbi:MFS transporter [Chloroflexota bacterium]
MVDRETQQYPGAKPRFFYGHVIIVAAFLVMAAMYGVHFVFGIFVKPILTEFGWTSAMTSVAFSLAMLVHGLMSIVIGGLTNRFGPRLVTTFCGFLLGLGYLLMSQISSLWQLYLVYGVIIGTGGSGGFVPMMSTVAKWFVKRRSMMSGIVVAGLSAGQLITPPIANLLMSTYDWRLSYIILGIMVLVVAVLAAQLLRRDPSQMGQVPYGQNEREDQKVTSVIHSFSLRAAISTRKFWLTFAIFLCFAFCASTFMVHIVPYAIDLKISAASAARILSTFGGLSIAGRLILGYTADRIGNRQVFIISFIMISATLFWLATAREVWILYLLAAIIGFAWGGCAASESPLVARLFGLGSHGLILGVTALGYTFGAALGPLTAGYIFDMTGRYQIAFFASAAIGIIGLILTAVLKLPHRSWEGENVT